MRDDLQRHLDGELSTEALDGTARDEADAWDRMVASLRREAPQGPAPAWLEQTVMAEIHALPEPSVVGRLVRWMTTGRPVRVSPLGATLVAAGFAAVLLVPARDPGLGPTAAGGAGAVTPVGTGGATATAPVVYVQFMLEAPGATSVAVAGDFSEWQPEFTLDDADGDGVWTGRVPIRPGVHGYMFLIDGNRWATDPFAERYQDDGFGNRNAVVAVGASD